MTDIDKLGKYEIRRELGRGAMGVVYEGYDPLIKRIVALKTIRADQLSGENAETIIARFRREAQAAGRLSHPNIVPIYDFGEEDGVWYIAMEYVNGRELKDYFQDNERFTTSDIVRIMAQILDALDYSHRQGVVHRDVKPANVILLPDGSVKVADFGIAHIETSNMTQVGMTLGTPAYMSPEQIMGLPVDGRSDIFSAGVILYQFLTGERPFSGTSTTTMRKVLEEHPLPPSRFNVQAPAAMDAVVQKALAKRPEQRFQTAREFAEALRAAAQSGSAQPASPAPEATLIDPAGAATIVNPAPAARAGAAAPLPAPPRTSQAAAIVIVGALALIAIGAAVWMLYPRAKGDAPEIAQVEAGAAPSVAQAPSAPAAAPPGATPAAAQPQPTPAVPATPPPAASPPKVDPGSVAISAVGLIDPSDPRYQNDRALQQSDLRADSKSQAVEKALGLLLEPRSLAQHYDVLRDKVLANSGEFITAVVQESAPALGKDGLMSMTTQAVVNVRAVQKSLNRMSRDERIELIRASGDPKVSVRITTRDTDLPDAPPQPSPIAENVLKERIRSFGFRTWSDEGRSDEGKRGADFDVQGEAKIRRLSMRLAASGLTVSKYALTSWTVKAIDRESGEEIYYNTTLPKGLGSWASEEEALKAIGGRIADEFSRDFFLQHVAPTGRKVSLAIDGWPGGAADDLLHRELVGLPAVIAVVPQSAPGPRTYELQLSGSGSAGDRVAAGVLTPLNAKLGEPCFSLGAVAGDRVAALFDARCAAASVLSRLETNPPAGLYGAPPARLKSVIKNPDTLRKLAT
jgi:serine/threonine-protein kinase